MSRKSKPMTVTKAMRLAHRNPTRGAIRAAVREFFERGNEVTVLPPEIHIDLGFTATPSQKAENLSGFNVDEAMT